MLRQLGNSWAAIQRCSSKSSESHHMLFPLSLQMKIQKKVMPAGYLSNVKLFSITYITLSLTIFNSNQQTFITFLGRLFHRKIYFFS